MPMSILAGIGNLVDDWLRVEAKGKPPHYRHRSAALELSRRGLPITGTKAFLSTSYAQIHSNWLAAIDAGYSNPSRENWRWKRHADLSPENKSPEIQLECSIVSACGDNWSNQMPTASGLVGPATDKRAAVDLVHRSDPGTYSLIELKVASDNPLFAAIQILLYGLLFVWSRDNQEKLGYDMEVQPVLAADSVTLSVLAPLSYYLDYDLTSLSSALNSGLAEFGEGKGVSLGFEFSAADLAGNSTSESVRSAIGNRRPVWVAGSK
jgi:hypothetical protein